MMRPDLSPMFVTRRSTKLTGSWIVHVVTESVLVHFFSKVTVRDYRPRKLFNVQNVQS